MELLMIMEIFKLSIVLILSIMEDTHGVVSLTQPLYIR